jgi:hypothetical protein
MRALAYVGPYEKFTKIRSDNPIREIWDMLLKHSDINYLSKCWEEKDVDDYVYVSNSLIQAHEYYNASKVLSLKTRPLLLYYSFLNLTKAILFLIEGRRPSNYHGLCKENIEKSIEKSEDFLSFSAEVNNGVFYQLAELLGCRIALKSRFTLEDFFSNMIELSPIFSDYFGKKSNFICPEVIGYTNGELKISFNKEILNIYDIKYDDLIAIFDKEFKVHVEEKDIVFLRKICEEGEGFNIFYQRATEILENYMSYSIFDDGQYYFSYINTESKIHGALGYFGTMYLLSSIVRYKPEHIYKLLDEKNISINWFFGKICDIAERVYPNMMLNLLYREKIKFSTSSF